MKLRLGSLFFASLTAACHGSSMKMDFLPFAHVRTDPIVAPTELSDHVHTFYGATVARPETTYDDLRNSYGGSGDVVENQSLYWHPTIYRVDEDGVHHMAQMYIGSAYYIWTPGATTAFPDGFKMIAFDLEENADGFFPSEPMDEFETEIWFPDCWDGVNIDSADHMSHVAYSSNRDVSGTCPDTHPVKIPKIEFFVRVAPYLGGTYVFSDGTTRLHADYFSGWDQNELQQALDNCDNGSFESAPDMFCEDHVTFKDLPKISSACGSLEANYAKVAAFQPPPLDTSTITDEAIDNVVELPRFTGTGTLKYDAPATLPPAPAPPLIPIVCEEGSEEETEDGESGEDTETGNSGEEVGEGEDSGEDDEEDENTSDVDDEDDEEEASDVDEEDDQEETSDVDEEEEEETSDIDEEDEDEETSDVEDEETSDVDEAEETSDIDEDEETSNIDEDGEEEDESVEEDEEEDIEEESVEDDEEEEEGTRRRRRRRGNRGGLRG